MKKLLIITLFLMPFVGFSQTNKPIEGFLGIKFGSSKADVLAALKAKGAIFDKSTSDNDALTFTNVKLGPKKAIGLLVRFLNDKAFEANYIFMPELESQILDVYNGLIDDVTRVYGDGKPTRKYNTPYEDSDNDGDKIVGLKLGDINFHTVWIDSNNNTIRISIKTNMTVNFQYQDNALAKEAIAKQNAKEKSDL
jgi:hypothetical protein